MEVLIKKAIQAIEEKKTEYAIGLLEGALEMTGTSLPKIIQPPIKMPGKDGTNESITLPFLVPAEIPNLNPEIINKFNVS